MGRCLASSSRNPGALAASGSRLLVFCTELGIGRLHTDNGLKSDYTSIVQAGPKSFHAIFSTRSNSGVARSLATYPVPRPDAEGSSDASDSRGSAPLNAETSRRNACKPALAGEKPHFRGVARRRKARSIPRLPAPRARLFPQISPEQR